MIANANTADVPELSSFCDVDIDSARVEFRIVYPHATHCVEYDYDSDGRIVCRLAHIVESDIARLDQQYYWSFFSYQLCQGAQWSRRHPQIRFGPQQGLLL